MAQQSEFVLITLINEELKRIVGGSRLIYMTALNAMFIAKKISGTASGFGTVTKELRVFSQKLNTYIDAMSGELADAIADTASRTKTRHTQNLLQRGIAHAGSALPASQRALILEQAARNRLALGLHKAATHKRLQLSLARLDRHCGVGENLGLLTKVESSTVTQYTRELATISTQIETVLVEIRASIEQALKLHAQVV